MTHRFLAANTRAQRLQEDNIENEVKVMDETSPSRTNNKQNKLTKTETSGLAPPTLWHGADRDFPRLQRTFPVTRTAKKVTGGQHTRRRSLQIHGGSDRVATNIRTSKRVHTRAPGPRSV